MRYFVLLCFLCFSTGSFSQKSKKYKENERKIYAHLDSLYNTGAFKQDTIGINGEKIDSFAHFPEGGVAWSKYITDNFPHDLLIRVTDRGIKPGQYVAWIEFVVYEDGTLGDFKTITNFGFGLEEGFIEIVQNSGLWIPARTKEKKISSKVKRSQLFEFMEPG